MGEPLQQLLVRKSCFSLTITSDKKARREITRKAIDQDV